jgi:hypothetical protein
VAVCSAHALYVCVVSFLQYVAIVPLQSINTLKAVGTEVMQNEMKFAHRLTIMRLLVQKEVSLTGVWRMHSDVTVKWGKV